MSDIGGGVAPSYSDLINTTKHQAAEIERLREHRCECGVPRDPNELCEARSMLLNAHSEDPEKNQTAHTTDLIQFFFDRIEELAIELSESDVINQRNTNENIRLQQRIEELEEKAHKNVWDQWGGGKVVPIDRAKIDAAWKRREDVRGKGFSLYIPASELGIVRCEGCGGSGWQNEFNDKELKTLCPGCAKYTGHGWVMGGDDE
jgi:hypothetical protein